jgi:hypothetical protein
MLVLGGRTVPIGNAKSSLHHFLSFTHRFCREAFYRWRIIPRMLVDTNVRDLSGMYARFSLVSSILITTSVSVELFGHRIPAPILFAPIGINKLYHPQGELVPAKIAGELGLPVKLVKLFYWYIFANWLCAVLPIYCWLSAY